jgi:hypothetical protein
MATTVMESRTHGSGGMQRWWLGGYRRQCGDWRGACATLVPSMRPVNAGGARVRWSEKAQREAGATTPEMAEREAEVADARVAR